VKIFNNLNSKEKDKKRSERKPLSHFTCSTRLRSFAKISNHLYKKMVE